MKFDAIVVGGSFAGLAAAMQLARARRRVALVDAACPRNRFSRASHGFLGQDGRAPRQIVATGRAELARYPTVTFVDGTVVEVERTAGGFHARLATDGRLDGARLVLAMGVRDELPSVPGVNERWGVSVVHCPYCDGYEHGGEPLGVLGSGPGSVHQALLISDWGPTTLFTQGLFEPDAEQLAKLTARSITIERGRVLALAGTAPALEAVRMEDGRALPLRALFVAPKTHMVSELPARLGCAFDEGPMGPFLRVDATKLTTVPGVYAAGDIASPMPNATVAAASGVLAGASAHQSLIFS